MPLLEMKFCILLFCTIMMFVKFQPSIYLNLHVVKIESGPIFGEENLNHFAFKGIPYAEADRFSPARPFSKRWHRILSFNKFGNACAQYDHWTYGFHGDEDCLNLNVYVPKSVIDSDELLPVIVFIHGGAFMFGGSEFYGQDVFMREQNMILVTINYRLGVLGFLSTEDEVLPGNLGLKDQVEALKWIQRNIGAFKGDRNNVTISGFSAGGASVHLHYFSPLSDGLFKNGISHSGVALNPWVMAENAREKAFLVGKSVGCKFSSKTKSDSKKLLKCLKKVPTSELVTAAKIFQPFLYNPFSPFGVVVEGNYANAFLTDHPQTILENRKFKPRPWITSVTRDEGLYPAAEFYTNKTLKQFDEKWNDLAPFLLDFNSTTYDNQKKLEWSESIRKFYFGDERINDENFGKMTKLMTDRLFKNGFYDAIALQSSYSNTYCYYFEYQTEQHTPDELRNTTDFLGVAHGDDVFLIYNNRKLREYTSDEKTIGQHLIEMYKLFNDQNIVKYAGKQIEASDGNTIKCMNIESLSDYSMKVLDKSFGEVDFWKSLNIPEYVNL